MNKFKVNNIYKDTGVPLDEIISKLFITFLDNDLKLNKINDIMSSDAVLNN